MGGAKAGKAPGRALESPLEEITESFGRFGGSRSSVALPQRSGKVARGFGRVLVRF